MHLSGKWFWGLGWVGGCVHGMDGVLSISLNRRIILNFGYDDCFLLFDFWLASALAYGYRCSPWEPQLLCGFTQLSLVCYPCFDHTEIPPSIFLCC